MDGEIDALISHQTWDITPTSLRLPMVSHSWVFTVKYRPVAQWINIFPSCSRFYSDMWDGLSGDILSCYLSQLHQYIILSGYQQQ